MNRTNHWNISRLHSLSLYFQGWCRIKAPFNCTRHLIAINRGRSPRPIVVVVINATVSYTSVYILHAAKTTVLLQGTIIMFLLLLKTISFWKTEWYFVIFMYYTFVVSVKEFGFFHFSPFIFRKNWHTRICTKVHFFVVVFFRPWFKTWCIELLKAFVGDK